MIVTKYCMMPFTELNCGVGGLYPCCSSWLVKYGSDVRSSIAGISSYWHSDIMNKFRLSIIDGSYSYCATNCPNRLDPDNSYLMKSLDEIQTSYPVDIAESIIDSITQKTNFNNDILTLGLSYDRTCNLHCKPCRKEPIHDNQRYIDLQHNRIKSYFDIARVLYLSGDGDPFASEYYFGLLKNDLHQLCPNLTSIKLQSNGILFNESNWNQIHPNNRKLIDTVTISVDAAHPDTYHKIRLGGDFNTLLSNLEFISTLRNKNVINKLITSYTVNKYNYNEMADFIDLAFANQFDLIQFWGMKEWGRGESLLTLGVHLPIFPLYSSFTDELNKAKLTASKYKQQVQFSF